MVKFLTKKNIIIFAAIFFALILTVVILLFTLFALKTEKISIVPHNEFVLTSTEGLDIEIVEKSQIKNKTSVFFIKKANIISTLEKQFPTLRFISIETVFPNALNIHIAEREALFAIKNTNLNSYTITDADFKVLEVLRESEFNALTQKPILVEFENSSLVNLEVGDFIKSSKGTENLNKLAKYFLINNRDVSEQKALFRKIEVYENNLHLYLQDGFMIKINDYNTKFSEKVDLMFKSMSLIYPTYYQNHFMEVYLLQSGKLVVKFSERID